MKKHIQVITAAVLMTACATTTVHVKESSNPVFFARPKGDRGPAIAYDLTTGARRFDLPSGMLSADGNVYAATQLDDKTRTTFNTFDPRTGDETLAMPMTGQWWLHAVSPDAKFVALTRMPSDKETQAWAKSGKWQTEFQIIDTQAKRAKHTLKLDGNFEAEALSKDGASLFLVEHLPAAKPDHYAIRWYDLSKEQLVADSLRVKTTDEIMSGYAWGGAATADGEWLFTLYISTNRKVAFVHMLNTKNAYTVCVDLPSANGTADFEALKGYTLAYSAKKQTLYAANARLGAVAEINLGNYAFDGTGNKLVPNKVVMFKPVTNDSFSLTGMPVPEALLTRDEGRMFFADGGTTYAYDILRGTVDKTYHANSGVTGLGLNPTGKLFVAQWPNAIQTFDMVSGRTILPATTKAACPITKPTRFVPPNRKPDLGPGEFWFGTDKLWTGIYSGGVWGPVRDDGSGYGEKVFWWSKDFDLEKEPRPNLLVTGTRLDAPARSATVSRATNAFAADIGQAMLVGVDFPTAGCWQITGNYRHTTLSFVVWVEP